MLNSCFSFALNSFPYSSASLRLIRIAFSAAHSRTVAAVMTQLARGGHTRANRGISGFSPVIRGSAMSFQRHTPSIPPVISAEVLQIVQQVRQLSF